MDELLKAINSMPAPKKKIHTVTIQGKTIEVSLQQSLDVHRQSLKHNSEPTRLHGITYSV